jgi:uncharacterized protein
MLMNGLILGAIAFGHCCVIVWVINVSHGYGMSERVFRKLEAATLLLIAVVSLWLLGLAVIRPWTAWPLVAGVYSWLCLGMALLAFPAVTIARRLRRLPAGIKTRGRQQEECPVADPSIWLGTHPRSWWLRIPRNESLELWTSEYEIELPGLPTELDGLRILHLSDFHCSLAYDRAYFQFVVDAASSIETDLVLFTGDLVDSAESIDWVPGLFRGLRGRLGQYAILGNHDFAQDYRHIYRAVLRSGFELLEGRWTTREIEGLTLALGGTSYPWGRPLDLPGGSDADFRILLSHSPDLFYQASTQGIDLMLSGHNHGGQVRLPGIGPVLMPSRFSRRFDQGFFRHRQTLLHVSPGIGAKHPWRANCPPEIARLVLRVPAHLRIGPALQATTQ